MTAAKIRNLLATTELSAVRERTGPDALFDPDLIAYLDGKADGLRAALEVLDAADRDAAEVRRPDACPKEGEIAPFDAGWLAHELGFDRETVRVLAADPEWALLGYDARAQVTT